MSQRHTPTEYSAAAPPFCAMFRFVNVLDCRESSSVYAPVSGEVLEVNAALKEKPEVVNADPHGSWMIVLRLTSAGETGALLDAAQYQDLVK